ARGERGVRPDLVRGRAGRVAEQADQDIARRVAGQAGHGQGVLDLGHGRAVWHGRVRVDDERLSGAAAVHGSGVVRIAAVLSVEVERAGAVELVGGRVRRNTVDDRVDGRGQVDPGAC